MTGISLWRLLLLCALLASCATSRAPHIVVPGNDSDATALLTRYPLAAGQSVRVERLGATERMSYHLVQLAPGAGERPHLHAGHDLAVFVLRGAGTLWIREQSLPLRTGDSAVIPAGTPHRFANTGDGIAAALIIFSPPHDGSDQVFLDGP